MTVVLYSHGMKENTSNFNPSGAIDLVQRILDTAKAAVPESLSQDVRNNVRAALQDVIVDLDVVSREEFDIQQAVLKKTRAKVDEMERLFSELEEKLNEQ